MISIPTFTRILVGIRILWPSVTGLGLSLAIQKHELQWASKEPKGKELSVAMKTLSYKTCPRPTLVTHINRRSRGENNATCSLWAVGACISDQPSCFFQCSQGHGARGGQIDDVDSELVDSGDDWLLSPSASAGAYEGCHTLDSHQSQGI